MSSLFGDTDIVTNTDSAFDHVQSLLVRVRHLIGMVDTGRSLFDEDDVLAELLEAHRTLTIMRVMSERYVIAVAGPQGAGKTTTMHWLYDIPEAYLPMNAITGERLPVLLIESDADDYQGYIYSYNEATSGLNRSPAEPKECKRTAVAPGSNDVMVEIAVPRRVFDIPGHGFLLLPGVEQGDSFHVRLAQRVLPTATTALMCVDSSLLARKTVDDEVRRIRDEMQIGDTKILYAVTKPQSEEKAASTVATIQDRFDVLDEQRIATIFPPNDQGGISWRNQIRKAIRDYGQIPQTRRDAKNKALRTTLYDLEDHLAVIEEKLDRKKVKIRSNKRISIGALFEEFDKAAEVQREELEKDLERKLSTYCEEAKDAVARRIRSEGTGNKIKRFFQAPLSERVDFQDMVRCEWEQIDDHGPAGVIMNTLNSVSQKFLPRKDGLPQIGRSASEDLPRLPKVERKDKMIGSLVLADREGEEVSPDMVHDVRYLMVAPKNSKQNNIEKRSDHFPLNVRMVPALALETMRVAFVANSLDGVTIGQEGAETALDEALSPDSLTEEVLNTREQGKGILKGIGAMVGLDVLPDGELDLVKEIVVAAGGTVKMAYLGPAVGALAATYAGFALIKSVRQHDINRNGAAQIAFERITSRTKENVLSVYDDYMAHVRRHMEQVVRKKLKVDREFADYYNVRAALIGVETSIRETKQRIPVGL